MAAIYQADLWCDSCAADIKDRLWLEHPEGPTYTDREAWEAAYGYDDELNYDSWDYPKDCADDEESDCPEHCAAGADCNEYEELSDGTRVGYFFGNSLTSDGDEYVKEAVLEDRVSGRADSVACEVWEPYYNYLDYDGYGYCIKCGHYSEIDEYDECVDCAYPCDGCDGSEGCSGDCYNLPCTD